MLRIGGSAATQSSYRRKRRYRRFSKSEITTFVSFVAFCKNSLRCIHLSFYRRKRSQGRACIPTERKFKLRFPPPEFFTEGNEGNESFRGRPRTESSLSSVQTAFPSPRGIFTEGSEANEGPQQETIFVLFVVFCLKSSAENLFFTEGNEGTEGRSIQAKYNLCSLRYLLFKLLPPPGEFLQKEAKQMKVPSKRQSLFSWLSSV